MERSKIISWYQCVKVQSLCKSHSLVYTSKFDQVYIVWSKPQLDNMFSVHRVSLCTNRASFFTLLLAVVSDHVWQHCSPTPSCIGIKRKQEVYANLCANRLNYMPMQPLQAKQPCRTCSQRRMGHMREHALRGGQNPCREEKVHMCIYIYSSIRLASPREI